jgi:hypothetical protein
MTTAERIERYLSHFAVRLIPTRNGNWRILSRVDSHDPGSCREPAFIRLIAGFSDIVVLRLVVDTKLFLAILDEFDCVKVCGLHDE